jgi:ribosomal protein S6--L-glutamate ligase
VTGDLALLEPIVEDTPLILKPYQGHRGMGIRVIRDPRELARLPAPTTPMLAQEYIAGDGEDLKIYVVGEEVFAVRKRFSSTSFADSGKPCSISDDWCEIARRCGRAFGLGLYGLDVVEGPQGPVVVDLNYFPGYKGIPNIASLLADHIDAYAGDERCLVSSSSIQNGG